MIGGQARLLAVLSVGVLGLVAVLYFGEAPDPVSDPRDSAVVVAPFEIDAVEAVTIARSTDEVQDTVELRKVDDRWRVVRPLDALAEETHVLDVIRALESSDHGLPVDGDPSLFGLEPPTATVSLTLAGGGRRTLIVGDATTVGYRTYVRASDGTVAAVRGELAQDLTRSAREFQDHRVFRYDPAEVSRARIQSAAGDLVARETEAGWILEGFGAVDLNRLDDWLVEMLRLRVDQFIDLSASDHIEQPVYLVQVDLPSESLEFRVGRQTPYGRLVELPDGRFGVISDGPLGLLARGPTDVGVRHAFDFDRSMDTRVTIDGTAYTQAEGEWTAPPDLLDALESLELIYERTPPEWDVVEHRVVLEGPEGQRVREIGPAAADGTRAIRDPALGGALRIPADGLPL